MEHVRTIVKWKEIESCPGYFVSTNGLVKKGKLLVRQVPNSCGRFAVRLPTDRPKGKTWRTVYRDVHILVFDAFGGTPRKDGYEIHHKDFNPQNNHIDNLQLISVDDHRLIHKNRLTNA